MSANFNVEKCYIYLKGYAMGAGWKDSVAALAFAREAHKGQIRKGGEPYIIHPLTVACHSVSLGINDDRVTAAAILHDVAEDCGIKVETMPVSGGTQDAVLKAAKKKAPAER